MIVSSRRLRTIVLTSALFALLSSFSLLALISSAQTLRKPTRKPSASSLPAARLNREIVDIVREIDARNIERTIRKLVSFGTRNTLSEQNDPNRGIGAARDWLYAEFQKAAAKSNGRMTVEKQTFEQPKAGPLHFNAINTPRTLRSEPRPTALAYYGEKDRNNRNNAAKPAQPVPTRST